MTIPRWLHVLFFGSLAALLVLVTAVLLRESGRPTTIEQRMVPALGVVDRCEHCHADAHPGDVLDTHPVERFGCTPCHGGQGLAITAADAHEAAPDWEHPLYDAAERESACGVCHRDERVTGAPPTKILVPTSFDLPGGSPSRMPAYGGLDPADAQAIGVALASLTGEDPPGDYRVAAPPQRLPGGDVGALVTRFRCLSCHRIDGVGGDISRIPLDGEGSRVQPDWLRAFLAAPVTLRMNQGERMPVLGMTPEEAAKLADWIGASLADGRVTPTPPGDAERGRATYARSGCADCHVLAGSGTMDGPTLDEAGKRLNPAWVAAMLADPALVPEDRHTRDGKSVRLPTADAADVAAYVGTLGVPPAAP